MLDPGQERDDSALIEAIERGEVGCFATDGKGYMLPSAGVTSNGVRRLIDEGLAEPRLDQMHAGSIVLTDKGRRVLDVGCF